MRYFRECDEGIFKDYIDGTAQNGGLVIFSFAPFGEYLANQETSDDFEDQRNSVYSKEASIERKIEIEKIEINKNKTVFPLFCKIPVIDFGKIKKGQSLNGSFTIESSLNDDLKIQLLNTDSNFKFEITKVKSISENYYKINFVYTPIQISGFLNKSLFLKINGFEEQLELFITSEITD